MREEKACKRAIPILREKEIQAKVISLKPYKDPDEFLKAEGKDALMERIHNAKMPSCGRWRN